MNKTYLSSDLVFQWQNNQAYTVKFTANDTSGMECMWKCASLVTISADTDFCMGLVTLQINAINTHMLYTNSICIVWFIRFIFVHVLHYPHIYEEWKHIAGTIYLATENIYSGSIFEFCIKVDRCLKTSTL